MNLKVVTKYDTHPVRQDAGTRRALWKLTGPLKALLIHAVLIGLALSMLAPFLWMVSTSLKVRGEVFTVPLEWMPRSLHFENYPNALSAAPFPRFFLNSLIIAIGVLIGRLVFCSMGSYA